MSFTSWLRNLRSAVALGPTLGTHRRQRSLRPTTHRPGLEVLEDRCLPSTFTVTNLLDTGAGSLRAAVAAANANPGADAIDFATTGTIALTSGQLDITDSLTINGPGASALTVSGNYVSRVFGIVGDPTVTIANLTVANGSTYDSPGGGISVAGGALTLDHVTVSGNYAGSTYNGDGLGGGLYVAGGTLTLDQSIVSGNYAIGAPGIDSYGQTDGRGGAGGGLYVAGGVVHVNQSTVSSNVAIGGNGADLPPTDTPPYWAYGGMGGYGVGGGIYVAAGTLEVRGSTLSGNAARGGHGGSGDVWGWNGVGQGGGLYIASAAPPLADLDTFTESNTVNNFADIDPNISGPYSLNGTWVPPLAISDVSTVEGNSGTTAFVFTVRLSAATSQAVSVHYATADGTAAANSDYQAASGTLTIPPGQTTGTITVLVNGDRLPEPNETFVVNLSSPTNAIIADGQGMGTIVDDEPRISIGDVTKAEGKKYQTTTFTFTVTLSAAYDQPVTMSFKTTGGTAKTSDSDYVAKTGTLTFNPGETTKTITIVVNGDSKKEANETFYLDLFGLSSNALFTRNRGLGTILNDD
jgi:hypothetical protein